MSAKRLEEYRQFLITALASRQNNDPKKVEEAHPQFSKDDMADAFAAALGRFTDETGNLKVSDTGGIRPVV